MRYFPFKLIGRGSASAKPSADKVSKVLLKLSRRRRFQVREITLDMAPNMARIARICFPAAKQVIDRFHVQKFAFEAVQEMQIKAKIP